MTAADHANTVREAKAWAETLRRGSPGWLLAPEKLPLILDTLVAQAEAWQRWGEGWRERAEAAEDENVRLADALRFYANEDDYLWHGDQRGIIQKNDRGAVARAALARTEDTP